jgi:negative regulator of sigma E activity
MEHQPFPPNSTKPPQSKFPWPLVALAVAAALLIATFWLTPRTNKASTAISNTVDQPTVADLQCQDFAARSKWPCQR